MRLAFRPNAPGINQIDNDRLPRRGQTNRLEEVQSIGWHHFLSSKFKGP